jgi:predicted transcriptional regulator
MRLDVFDMLFGCWHARTSFPITTRKGAPGICAAARVTGTYVVCLDCGREFPYDWKRMKVLAPAAERRESAPLAEPGYGKAA